jgi:hypothetical protein
MPVNGGQESSLMLRPIIGAQGQIDLYCADEECPCPPEDGKRLVFTIPNGYEFSAMEIEEFCTEHVRQAYALAANTETEG